MMDEKSKRRDTFMGGVPVLLADGQEWILPKPRVRFTIDDGESGCRTFFTVGDAYGKLIDDAVAAEGEDIVKTELALGKYLLLVNYDLTSAEIGTILQFAYDQERDPEGYAIRMAVLDVANGRSGPKPSGDGGASPPT